MLLVHDLGPLTHGEDHARQFDIAMQGAFPVLANLKRQGLTRGFGLGVNEVAICLQVLAEIDLDVILLAGRYTLLEQAPLQLLHKFQKFINFTFAHLSIMLQPVSIHH